MNPRLIRRTALALAASGLALAVTPAQAETAPPLQLPALRAESVTKSTLALAERLVALENDGRSGGDLARLGAAMGSPLLGGPKPELLAAFQAAMGQSEEDLKALDAQLAEVYARNYTDEELAGLIGYLESPAGRSTRRKRLAAMPGRAVLSPEEAAAAKTFEESPIGQSLARKKMQVTMASLFATAEIRHRITQRAIVLYCASNACPKPPAEGKGP
jgi:hypothetical protein